ncbi:hypothetical protein Hanom_Chr15g01355171 [Helianthus anomalus]
MHTRATKPPVPEKTRRPKAHCGKTRFGSVSNWRPQERPSFKLHCHHQCPPTDCYDKVHSKTLNLLYIYSNAFHSFAAHLTNSLLFHTNSKIRRPIQGPICLHSKSDWGILWVLRLNSCSGRLRNRIGLLLLLRRSCRFRRYDQKDIVIG